MNIHSAILAPMHPLPRLRAGALVALVVGSSTGCRPPPANFSLRPSGTTWACTRDRALDTWSLCERVTADCEATAAAVRADAQAEAAPANIPPCHPQRRAVCYTFHSTKAGNDNFMCYETMRDCDTSRRLAEGSEYVDVSRCDEWE